MDNTQTFKMIPDIQMSIAILEFIKSEYEKQAPAQGVQKYIGALQLAIDRLNHDSEYEKVKHGKWTIGKEPSGSVYAHCSACNRKMNDYCYGYLRCPICGAKMDG